MPYEFRGIPNNTHEVLFKDPGLRRNMFWVGSLILSSVFIGYDSSLFNSLQALPSFFGHFPVLATDSNLLGLVGAVYSLAGIYTAFIAAWLADKYGRKVPIVAGMALMLVGPNVMAFAPNLGVLIFGRWILGTATFMILGITATLTVELAQIRPIAGSLFLSGYYASRTLDSDFIMLTSQIGGIICSFATLGTYQSMPNSIWAWRIPTLLQMALPAVLLPIYVMLPHSPRWLIAQGRYDDARRVFAAQHANGQEDDPLVSFQMEETTKAIELELQRKGFKELISSRPNRWRAGILVTFGVGSNFTGAGVVTYYLVPVLVSVGITSYTNIILISAGLNISNFFFTVLAAFLVERAGRRVLWISSTSIMLVSMVIVTALSATFDRTGSSSVGMAVVAFLYIFFAGYDIGYTALAYCYPTEILPYTLRTTGLAFQNAVGCIGLFFNTWINPIALSAIGWRYYFVFIGCLIALLTIIYFYFPETKGMTLEEVAVVFEGPQAATAGLLEDRLTAENGTPFGMTGVDKKDEELHVEHTIAK